MRRLLLTGLMVLQSTMALGQSPVAVRPSPEAVGRSPAAMRPSATPAARGGYVQPHPAVARIVAPEKDGTSFGSGTLIDVRGEHGLVVTNWHVIRDVTGELSVIFPDGFRSGAKLIKVDQDWDLAALAIWRPNAQPVTLARVAPQKGEPLTIAGYGQGDYRMVTGRCTQYVSPRGDFPFEMVELSATARNGDSGGPIFNTRGELAGVLFGANSESTAGSYCGRVAQFLASVMPNGDPPDASAGMVAEAGRAEGAWVAAADRTAVSAPVPASHAAAAPTAPVIAASQSNRPPVAAVATSAATPTVLVPDASAVDPVAIAAAAPASALTSPRVKPAISQQPLPDTAEPTVAARSIVKNDLPASPTPTADKLLATSADQPSSKTVAAGSWWSAIVGSSWLEQGKTLALVLTAGTFAARLRKSRKEAKPAASQEDDEDEDEVDRRPRKIKISGKQAAAA